MPLRTESFPAHELARMSDAERAAWCAVTPPTAEDLDGIYFGAILVRRQRFDWTEADTMQERPEGETYRG